MSGRLWYPQLDVFDAVRRIGGLLEGFAAPPGTEKAVYGRFFSCQSAAAASNIDADGYATRI